MRRMDVFLESWPLRHAFRSGHGTITIVETVMVRIRDGAFAGRGECRPFAPYGFTRDDTIATLRAIAPRIEAGADTNDLLRLLPACPARNAIDCALWDLDAKMSGRPVSSRLGWKMSWHAASALTLQASSSAELKSVAEKHAHWPLLKVKATGDDDLAWIAAAREGAGNDAKLIVDANGAWSPAHYADLIPGLASFNIALLEQPLAPENDDALRALPRPVPICADESFRDADDLPRLQGLYDAVNLKLDKVGGMTAALQTISACKKLQMRVMVGSLISSSLAVAPAVFLAGLAEFADLDGFTHLQCDRDDGLEAADGIIGAPTSALWG